MAGLPLHSLDAQWWDDDVESTEIGPYFPSGREASISAWLEMNSQGGVPSDLSGGQYAQYLAAQVGDATVDPQNLMLRPNASGLDFPSQVWDANLGTPFLEGSLENDQLEQVGFNGTGLVDAPNPPVTYPEVDPCSPASAFIPDQPMFVALQPASHDLDN
jgi:hypothetical protein